MTRRGAARVVVVFDASCGACSAIAARLSEVLVPEVIVRSCRDPRLSVEFPVLARHLGGRPCRRPLLVTVGHDGAARVLTGPRMLIHAATLVAPRRYRTALRLGLEVCATRLRHLAQGRRVRPSDTGAR